MTKKNTRAEALASRIEQGASELAAFAEGLSESEWRKPCNDRDRRTLKGKLGAGGKVLKIRTGDGSIRLKTS